MATVEERVKASALGQVELLNFLPHVFLAQAGDTKSGREAEYVMGAMVTVRQSFDEMRLEVRNPEVASALRDLWIMYLRNDDPHKRVPIFNIEASL